MCSPVKFNVQFKLTVRAEMEGCGRQGKGESCAIYEPEGCVQLRNAAGRFESS